jgi:hypothetical protein
VRLTLTAAEATLLANMLRNGLERLKPQDQAATEEQRWLCRGDAPR